MYENIFKTLILLTMLWRIIYDNDVAIGSKVDIGGAGHRSRYLSHAKRALYHLSYAPSLEYVLSVQHHLAGRQQCKLVLKDTFHPTAGNHDI